MTPATDDTPSILRNGRYRQILIFFGSMILHTIWMDLFLGRVPLLRIFIRNGRPVRSRRWARRFRHVAVEMGGVMIKLGQFLSARVDVLPPEITDELMGLQDEVPPVPTREIFAALANELGDVSKRFTRIEEQPLAAASLGQAHRAWLKPDNGQNGDGLPVVVKIQRPHIEETVRVDLAALRVVARWLMNYRPISRRADAPALMEEFSRTLWEELDYESEADNAERFAQIHADDHDIGIPLVYRQHSTSRVIVLENVESIKITDTDALFAVGIDPIAVGDRLLEIYFQQIFLEGFFHADPHPGNLFVKPLGEEVAEGEQRPFQLTFVDFGMVGNVPDLMGDNLRKILVSLTQRDAHQMVEAARSLGFFLPGADLDRIAEAFGILLDRMWGRNLLSLSRPDPAEVQELGKEFRDILFDFPFQIPNDFIYLGRAVGMVSGLVSLLDPEINPWYQFEKFGEELVKQDDIREWNREAVLEFIQPYLGTPLQVKRLLDAAENGRFRIMNTPDRETRQRLDRLEKKLGQLSWSIIGAAGIISATLIHLNRTDNKTE